MKLGVYFQPDSAGPLVLVALCMRPSIAVEHLHGPLVFQGAVETDDPVVGIDWPMLLAQILDATYTSVERQGLGRLVVSVMDAEAQPTEALLHPGL